MRRLLVVKDFPNMSNSIVKNSVHEMFTEFVKYSRIPLVLIVTDMKTHCFSHNDSKNESDELLSVNSILPLSIRNSKYFAQISYNVIAPSILLKALKRIVSLEFRLGKKAPSAEQLEFLSNLGDIRKAINHLQFQTYEPIVRKKGKKMYKFILLTI